MDFDRHDEVFNYFEQPITNAYTESVNGLAKLIYRMGRGYSFEVIRARMLYEPKARKAGAAVVQVPDPDAGFLAEYVFSRTVSAPTQQTMRRVIEYGPHIPTLIKLLEKGHFE